MMDSDFDIAATIFIFRGDYSTKFHDWYYYDYFINESDSLLGENFWGAYYDDFFTFFNEVNLSLCHEKLGNYYFKGKNYLYSLE